MFIIIIIFRSFTKIRFRNKNKGPKRKQGSENENKGPKRNLTNTTLCAPGLVGLPGPFLCGLPQRLLGVLQVSIRT
jgi:hypothetical protein